MCDNERSKYEKLASDAILSGETSGEGDEKSTLTKKDDHKHLLVLVDGSKYGNTAFEKALSFKRPQDVLFIVHVLELRTPLPLYAGGLSPIGPGPITGIIPHHINEGHEKNAKCMLMSYLQYCKKRDIKNVFTKLLKTLDSEACAVRYAKSQDVDTIFVGTRGNSRFKSFFIGSFSNYILSHAECDVLLVRTTEEKEKE